MYCMLPFGEKGKGNLHFSLSVAQRLLENIRGNGELRGARKREAFPVQLSRLCGLCTKAVCSLFKEQNASARIQTHNFEKQHCAGSRNGTGRPSRCWI